MHHLYTKLAYVLKPSKLSDPFKNLSHIKLHGEFRHSSHLAEDFFPQISLGEAIYGESTIDRDEIKEAVDALRINISKTIPGGVHKIANNPKLLRSIGILLSIMNHHLTHGGPAHSREIFCISLQSINTKSNNTTNFSSVSSPTS